MVIDFKRWKPSFDQERYAAQMAAYKYAFGANAVKIVRVPYVKFSSLWRRYETGELTPDELLERVIGMGPEGIGEEVLIQPWSMSQVDEQAKYFRAWVDSASSVLGSTERATRAWAAIGHDCKKGCHA